MTVPPPQTRRSHQRGIDTRREILDAALGEFAAVGFDAASTRSIAGRAGIPQGQLTYHFATKDALWRATVDRLFERFDDAFRPTAVAEAAGADDAAARLDALVRALVRAVSRLPELNRIMIHEATADTERLTWLVDRHVRSRFEELASLWRAVRAEGGTHLDADPLLVYYTVVGAASLRYVNNAEAAQLAGDRRAAAVTDALVEAHADIIVAMLLGPLPHRTPPRGGPS